MADQDPTRDDTARPEAGSRTSTQLSETDPIPSSDPLAAPIRGVNPDTRDEFDPRVSSTVILIPADSGSTRDLDIVSTLDRETRHDAFPGYTLLETLGQGGMGVVYKARQEGLNRLVAFKVILGGQKPGPKDLIRFLAEAEAVASIRHPNVVLVFEYGEADGCPFLAMEHLPGGSLADRIRGKGRLAPRIAADLVAKLARAVQAAHDQGIVHRDLKPANVLFDQQDEPRVTDFGLAKRATGTDLTHTRAVMGTPAYMSPEQARGNTKFVGPPADVYALGVILYECLIGARPFQDAVNHVLLRQVIEDEPLRPSKCVPGLPHDLELITLKCLAKDPVDRYPTASALADDLSHFIAGEPVSVRDAGPIERALKWARRKPTLAAAYALMATVVVLLAFGASLAILWRMAESAKSRAELAQAGEKRARELLARVEYGRTMQVAHHEWRDNNNAATLSLLGSTRIDLRGWEWNYLNRLCHGEILELKGHTAPVSSVCWSPDGSRIATAGYDNTARVWDTRSGEVVLELKGHTAPVSSVSWSPDGSRIATASYDNTARVWDARSGAEAFVIKWHVDPVLSVSWSPDGSRIATASRDNAARIWDAESGAHIVMLKGHSEPVTSVCWSPDGSRIATTSNDESAGLGCS